MSFLERFGLLVEQECLEREHRKQDRLVRQARFKLRATIQDIDYQHPQYQAGPDRPARAGEWIERAQNLLITGPAAAVRPIWPAPWGTTPVCKATARATSVCPAVAGTDPGEGRWQLPESLKQIAKTQLLLLDDWGLEALTAAQRNDLMEIMDDRHGATSTVMISQLPTDQWYAAIGDNTLADAILTG